jgi:uncharacterized damage-inducible protein DinB
MSSAAPGAGWFARLLRYDGWANAEALRSLDRSHPPPKALRWMAHIVGSGDLWLARLRAEPPTLAVWPDLDLDGCAAGLARLAERWPRYLDSMTDADISGAIGYHNTRGEYWTGTVADILTHVIAHGAYHRGQIAAAVRESGGEPAHTDFIHAARTGLVS